MDYRRSITLTDAQRSALKFIAAKLDTSAQVCVSAAVDALIASHINADPVIAACVARDLGVTWAELEAVRNASSVPA